MNLKGVTFDIGGVLYSDDVFKRAVKKALIKLGAEVTDQNFEKVYDDHLKSGGGSLRSKLCTVFLGSLERKKELLRTTNDFWLFESSDMYSDALSAVKSLKELGLLIAIIANQPATVRDTLTRDGFDPYLDFVGISDIVGLEKPNPEFFELAVNELGLKASEMVHIGNRIDNDVKPAKSIGMKTIWIMRGEANPNPTDEDLKLPDISLPNLENLALQLGKL
jgi:putative hydrolase of the HAD superfamily